MTANQQAAMDVLGQYVGQTVQVLTSGYTANVNPEAVRNAVGGTFSSAALRGLEAKGYLVVRAYWKGATVTVLKAA